MKVHWKKSTNGSKGKPEQKFDAAVGILFRISKCFQRSKQRLHINFSLEQALKKYSTCGIIHLNKHIFYSTLLRFASQLVFFFTSDYEISKVGCTVLSIFKPT